MTDHDHASETRTRHHGASAPMSQLRSEALCAGLRRIAHSLEVAVGVVALSSQALRLQNCDHDIDIAKVLQHCVGDRLDRDLARMRALLAQAERELQGEVALEASGAVVDALLSEASGSALDEASVTAH